MQVLFGEQVGGDALDFVRGTAVQCGYGNAAGDAGGDGVDICALCGEELFEHPLALDELRRVRRVHHVVDVGVDLFALDALQVIAHGHVEHETVRIAESVDLTEDLERAPGLDVFILRLGHGQLGGPLLIVALVHGKDAGARHAGGQLLPVHLLHGFDLKEARTGKVGGNDVLRELAVWPGGGAKGRFDLLTEDRQRLARGMIRLVDAEDIAAGGVFGYHPVHQRGKGDRIHFFGHGKTSFYQALQMGILVFAAVEIAP